MSCFKSVTNKCDRTLKNAEQASYTDQGRGHRCLAVERPLPTG